jgi:hypothetical protein
MMRCIHQLIAVIFCHRFKFRRHGPLVTVSTSRENARRNQALLQMSKGQHAEGSLCC